MSTVTLVMGPPYSGKSTFLEKFSNRKDLVTLSAGSVHSNMSNGEKVDSDALWWGKGGVVEQVVSALEKGYDVAVEGSFKERASRVRFIQEIRRLAPKTKVEGVFMQLTTEEMKARFDIRQQGERKPGAWQRVRRMHKALNSDPPGILDGFDKLFTVNGKGVLDSEKIRDYVNPDRFETVRIR